MRRTFAVGALAATLVGLSATPAIADDDGGDWPEGRGEFVPADNEYYEQEVTFEACDGRTFTITGGDVRKAKFRETELKNGRSLSEYRGPETIDITRDDGVVLDELEVGGYARTLTIPREDGSLIIRDQLFGESLFFPFTPEDSDVFIEEFGSDLVYFEDDDDFVTLELLIADAEDEESIPEITDIKVNADLIDLCEVFDELAEEGKDEDGKDKDEDHATDHAKDHGTGTDHHHHPHDHEEAGNHEH